MRIKNWVGASTLASAACLLAACGGFDPSDPGATTEAELGGYQTMARATDLSQGAACVESVRPAGLECPGLSPLEQRTLAASVAPRLMGMASTLRVTVVKTGNTLLAKIDGGERGQAFENLFGTSTLLAPIQQDGTFEITTPIAEQGASMGRGFGAMGAGPGFGMSPGLGGAFGAPGIGSQIGARSLMSPVGGGPAFAGQANAGDCGCPSGLQGQLGASQIAPRSGPPAQEGFGPEACGACGPQLPGFGMASPGFGSSMMPRQNAYAVEAHLQGKVDLANVQFAPDEVNNTETAILDQDQALQMQGEIVLIPLTGAGFEQGEPGGQQAFPGGPQAAPMAPRGGAAWGGGPSQAGQLGPGAQQVPQGQAGQFGQQHPTAGPQAGFAPPSAAQPGIQGPGAEVGAACRIPLQICGSCGFSTEGAHPAIVTTPVVPEMPACPQMIIRPTMASPCCPGAGPAVSPMSFGGGASCGGCQ